MRDSLSGETTLIVPVHWAEGKAKGRIDERRVTLRRFGWSDESAEAAQRMADARAREAFARRERGEKVAERELKVPYNGAEGVPIREEIVARYGDTIETRNLYGARCLNSPDALFVDVDFATEPEGRHMIAALVAIELGALAVWLVAGSARWGCAVAAIGLLFVTSLGAILFRAQLALGGGGERIARRRIEAFGAAHGDWSLRLYRTPAGFRLLATHRVFDPTEPAVESAFAALGADPVYAKMCKRQRCFRARVSPKPWRAGMAERLRPRPGVWPVKPVWLPQRAKWVEQYERRATRFASCRFVATLGAERIAPALAPMVELHDRLCRATSELPLA